MECVDLVSRIGYVILVLLVLVGLGGVGLHALWSRRLAFVDFNKSDPSNKSNLKRLFLPAFVTAILSMFIPIIFVIASTPLRRCLEDSSLSGYLPVVLKFVLPVVGTGIYMSVLVCALVGFIWYWIFGVIVYFITRKRGEA